MGALTISTRRALLTPSGTSLLKGLVSYWKFDDASGSSVADAVGTNTGTWQGTLGSQWGAGKIAGGGVFNGTDNRVLLPAAMSVRGLSAFTIAGWIKTPTLPGSGLDYALYFESVADSASSTRAGLFMTNGARGATGVKFAFSVRTGAAASTIRNTPGSTTPVTNTWYHVAGVFTTSVQSLYVNGVLDGSLTVAEVAIANTAPLAPAELGRTGAVSNTYLLGTVDEEGIWSRALSPTEVAQLYNGGSGRAYPFA